MKIMKYIVPALLGGMLTLQSCEHFLDTKPTETYSEELVWGSRSTADAFVLRTYPDILGLYHDFWGDDQITLNTILRQSCPGEARDLINREHDFGFNKFSIIRRCNLIIEQASASTALSDLDKKELVAEGKMLRAMIYYYQAKHCGRVIWVDRVLQVDDEFNLPLTESIDRTYDLILSDLDDAIAGLPEEYPAGLHYGCYTKEDIMGTSGSSGRCYPRLFFGRQLWWHVQSGELLFFNGDYFSQIFQ